jgi:sortase (surface protein transpeptidase)
VKREFTHHDCSMPMRSQRPSHDLTCIALLAGLLLGLATITGCAPVSAPAAVVADAPAVVNPSPTLTITQPPPTATSVPPTATPTATRTPTPTFTATTTPSPTPTPTPGLPVRLRIPAIGVDAFIEPVGLTEEQAMDVPSRWEDVAWFRLGYRPGMVGNAVIAGHLDTNTGAPAVFWDLNKLQPGDEVIVVGDDGVERVFLVEGAEVYPYDQAPVQRIFGPADRPQLNLITCDGAWNREVRNYSHRLVVYTVAAP